MAAVFATELWSACRYPLVNGVILEMGVSICLAGMHVQLCIANRTHKSRIGSCGRKNCTSTDLSCEWQQIASFRADVYLECLVLDGVC